MNKPFDPYDILGVPRDATPQDVKAAYRKRVKKTHPDVGGDKQEFERVSMANVILSDPKLRESFDATGDVAGAGPDNGDAAAVEILVGLFNAIMDQSAGANIDPEAIKLTKVMTQMLTQRIADMNNAKLPITAKLNKLLAVTK